MEVVQQKSGDCLHTSTTTDDFKHFTSIHLIKLLTYMRNVELLGPSSLRLERRGAESLDEASLNDETLRRLGVWFGVKGDGLRCSNHFFGGNSVENV